MSTSTPAVTDRRPATTGPLLRALGALTLGYSGYLHLRIALDRPPLLVDGGVTLMGLFVAQAVAVLVVVVWVLVRAGAVAWLAFAVVAVASLAALLLSVVVRIPAIGPFPEIHEPAWYTDKTLAAASAGAAVAVAVVALAVLRRRRAG